MTITIFDGTLGADTLIGTGDSDMLFGYDGNDSLVGGAGDDTLDGGAGTNRIDAGDGNDVIVIDGTATNGVLLTPATGIDGGAGYDTVVFQAASTNFHINQIAGGYLQVTDLTTGARTIAANVEHLQFTDTDIYLSAPPSGVILGTAGADTLTGTDFADTIKGFDGNDSIDGGAGNDYIDAGSGTNRIDGGAGDDIILSGTASNGAGHVPANGIDGGTGYDTVTFAGASTDYHVVNIVGGPLRVTNLTTGQSDMIVNVEHLQFSDIDVYLKAPNLNPPVVSGDVTVTATEGDAAVAVSALANATDADAGAVLSVTGLAVLPDGVTFDAVSQSVILDATAPAFDALAAGESLDLRIDFSVTDGTYTTAAGAVLKVIGTNDAAQFAGTLTGSATEDSALQAGGVIEVTDVDHGQSGILAQGPVAGSSGIFALNATGAWSYALNSDLLSVQSLGTGQSLTDTFAVQSLDGTLSQVSVQVQGMPDASLLVGTAGAETLTGTAGADQMFGQGGADRLSGKGGNDHLDGGAGADILSGDAGNDRIGYDVADLRADGGTGIDTLVVGTALTVNLGVSDQVGGDKGVQTGFENVDATFALASVSLTGSAAANALTGGWADDILRGGRGADMLAGGAGADSFVFASVAESSVAAGIDTISDFASGVDHLDLSLIDAVAGGAVNNAFHWVGDTAFGSTAGELRYSATDGLLQGDVTGDGVADFSVLLANHAILTVGDFLL